MHCVVFIQIDLQSTPLLRNKIPLFFPGFAPKRRTIKKHQNLRVHALFVMLLCGPPSPVTRFNMASP